MNDILTTCAVLTILWAACPSVKAAPQEFVLPWIQPTPWMDLRLPPHAIEPLREPLLPLPLIYSHSPLPAHELHYPYYPGPNELDDFEQNLRLGSAIGASTVDDVFDFDEGFRQNAQSDSPCSRTRWRKTSCFNSTTVVKCRPNGSFTSRQCPSGANCVNQLGVCLRGRRLSRSFTCPGAGFFPDPNTCRVYHVCAAGVNNILSATNFTCYWPQVYDPQKQSCQRESKESPCYRFKCAGRGTVAYPGDANIYATCSTNNRVASLSKCEPNCGWDDAAQECQCPYCTKEGNIPALNSNASQYYTCSRVFKRLVRSELKTCPEGISFNSTAGICLPTDQIQFKLLPTIGEQEIDHISTESGQDDSTSEENYSTG